MDYNKVIIAGRLTAKPELRTTPGGQSVTQFSVAVNRKWLDQNNKKQEETEFVSCVVWGKKAEHASTYLDKGSSILVDGRLRTRGWTDKQGNQRRTTEVMVETMQFGERQKQELPDINELPY